MNEKGYKGASVQEISNLVGLHKSTLFHYFNRKEDILRAVLETAIWKAIEFIEGIANDKALSPEEKLKRAIFGHIDWMVKYIDNVSVYHSEIRYLSGSNKRKYMRSRKQYESCLIRLIDQVKRQNSENFKGLDSRIVAFGILGMVNWVVKWYNPKGPLKPKDIAKVFYRIVTEQMVVSN